MKLFEYLWLHSTNWLGDWIQNFLHQGTSSSPTLSPAAHHQTHPSHLRHCTIHDPFGPQSNRPNHPHSINKNIAQYLLHKNRSTHSIHHLHIGCQVAPIVITQHPLHSISCHLIPMPCHFPSLSLVSPNHPFNPLGSTYRASIDE
jgi:hypothetical protein